MGYRMIQISGDDCEDMCGIVEEIENKTKKLKKYLKKTAEDSVGYKMHQRDEDEDDDDEWRFRARVKGSYNRY